MRAARTITCADCGHQYETIQGNTKRCSVCQLVNSLSFVHGQLRECEICEKEYAPIERGDVLCGDCSYKAVRPGRGECVLCKQPDKKFIRVDVAVCHHCARDPKLRPRLYKSLLVKQGKREAEAA